MKIVNWQIISTFLVDLGLFITFIAIDCSHKISKLFTLVLFIIGLVGLLVMVFKKYFK